MAEPRIVGGRQVGWDITDEEAQQVIDAAEARDRHRAEVNADEDFDVRPARYDFAHRGHRATAVLTDDDQWRIDVDPDGWNLTLFAPADADPAGVARQTFVAMLEADAVMMEAQVVYDRACAGYLAVRSGLEEAHPSCVVPDVIPRAEDVIAGMVVLQTPAQAVSVVVAAAPDVPEVTEESIAGFSWDPT